MLDTLNITCNVTICNLHCSSKNNHDVDDKNVQTEQHTLHIQYSNENFVQNDITVLLRSTDLGVVVPMN